MAQSGQFTGSLNAATGCGSTPELNVVPTPPGSFPGGLSFYIEASREHDRFIAQDHDFVLNVPAHGAREHGAFGVPTFANHVGQRVTVRDAYDVLLDDWSLVEHAGHVVARGADKLDATFVRPVVRSRADESRQE
jgi:hypothetical protein